MTNEYPLKPVYFISPTHPLGEIQYRIFCKRFSELIAYKNETKLFVTLISGTDIFFKSAERPDLLRSNGLCGVIIDEIGFVKEEVWDAVRPMLSDIGAPAILCSTPSPLGPAHWASELWERHKDDPEWDCLERTAIEMGVLKPEEIESARRSMLPDAFATEYLAKRISREGQVYREFGDWNIVDALPKGWMPARTVCGLDLGYDHPSVFVPLQTDAKRHEFYVLEALYHPHGNEESHIQIAKDLRARLGIDLFLVDHNRPDFVDRFRREGLPVELADKDILEGIDDVRKLLLKREGIPPRLKFIRGKCKELLREFPKYRYLPGTNKPNKQVGHDDGLDALRYGVKSFSKPRGRIVENLHGF